MEHPHAQRQDPVAENPTRLDPQYQNQPDLAAGERSRSSRMVLAHPNSQAHDAVTVAPGRSMPTGGQRADPAGSRQELLSSHWGMEHPHAQRQDPVAENPTRINNPRQAYASHFSHAKFY